MKLTKSTLKQIIKEELQNISLQEQEPASRYNPRTSMPGPEKCGDNTCKEMNDDIDMLQDQIEYLKNIIRDLGGTVPG
jgi:hypothetical protein